LSGPTGEFHLSALDDQPSAVARYFDRAVAPGAPVVTAVRLRMRGRLRVGRVWLPFRAEETLAPREGFRWVARVAGTIRGADSWLAGRGRMRWTLAGGLPLVEAEGPDVGRSAAGRCGAESIWAPTAVLPGPGVVWSAADDHHIGVRFSVGDTPVELDLRLDDWGDLRSFRTQRWGDPDGTGRWGWHPFGGQVDSLRAFGPYTVPDRGRVGWYPDSLPRRHGEFFRFHVSEVLPVGVQRLT